MGTCLDARALRRSAANRNLDAIEAGEAVDADLERRKLLRHQATSLRVALPST